MSSFSIVVITANILGSFQDPFEFSGDYGAEMNPVREKVFELVVPEIAPQITFKDLIPSDLYESIDDPDILAFLFEYQHQNAYEFLRNCPKEILQIDKKLRDQAAKMGKSLKLSILSSTYPLIGANSKELKNNLLNQLLSEEITSILKEIDVKDKRYTVFNTPKKQIYFYWLYQCLNLHLISQNPEFIQEINKTKQVFSETIGNAYKRAAIFKEKLQLAGTGVLFTQECDRIIVDELTKNNLFFLPQGQIPHDGCFIFLNPSIWEKQTEALSIDNYEGYRKGKINLVIATNLYTKKKFLLASCHGNSTNPADGRLQVSLIMEKYHSLLSKYPELQLIIGIDANTKTEEAVEDFYYHLDSLGLMGTHVGPTTVKQRMVTVQHKKSKRKAVDQEDYLITLKPQLGGEFTLTHATVGFEEVPLAQRQNLPNLDNLSDHYPVKALLAPKK